MGPRDTPSILLVMTRSLLSIFYVLCPLLFIFSACNKYTDLAIPDNEREFAIPLVNTDNTIKNMVENFDDSTFITVAEDGFMTLNYKGDVATRSSADLFVFFQDVLLPVLDTIFPLPVQLPEGVSLEYAILKSGTLKTGVYNPDQTDLINVHMWIEEFTFDGVPYTKDFQVFPGGIYVGAEEDITGFKLAPTNDSVFVRYTAVKSNGEHTTLTGLGIIAKDMEASYAQGILGTQLFEFPADTIEINFFENWTLGQVNFTDPRITVFVDNSFGIPVGATVQRCNIITQAGDILPLESPYVDSGFDFPYPELDEVGQTKSLVFYFDKDNSNIEDLIGQTPVALDYDLDGVSYPGSSQGIIGFLTDSSRIEVQVEVQLPLEGSLSGFAVTDSLDFDPDLVFSSTGDIREAELKMVTQNSIPLDVQMQVYMADENGIILDSVFAEEQMVLVSAPIDDNGIPTGIAEQITYATLDAESVQNLRQTRKILIRTAFSTTSMGSATVRIYADQGVSIGIGMRFSVD